MIKSIHIFLVMLLCCVSLQMQAQSNPTYTLSLAAIPAEGGVLSGSGEYIELEEIEISATAAEGFAFVHWTSEDGTIVSEEASFTFTMSAADTSLFAHFTCAPDWEAPPGFQYNMQIVAQLVFNEEISNNPNDIVAAFVGQEYRGIASPMPEFDGLVFLTVGSNEASGEKIQLKLWNGSSCDSCIAFQQFDFVNQGTIGSLANPYLIECFQEAQLFLDFEQGYNWFSINILQNSMDLNDVFSELEPCANDRIIGQQEFALYTGEHWIGTLQQFSTLPMYRMRLCSTQSISLIGNRSPVNPILLNAGFTWLGYLPQQCLLVNDALAGLDPEPVFNDRIIGHNAFALYTGEMWVGSLSEMCPGEGYIIKLANNSVLSYPDIRQMDGTVNAKANNPASKTTAAYNPPRNLQHTMMVVAKLLNEKGQASLNHDDILYAFIDGQCRGMASPDPELDGLVFMNIGEDSDNRKEVSFKLWSAEHNQMTDLNQQIVFEPLSEAGTLQDPLLLMTGNLDVSPAENRIESPSPNPFDQQTTLHFRLAEAGRIHLRLFNSMGQVVRQMEELKGTGGNYSLLLERETLKPGLYWLVGGLHTASASTQQTFSLIVK